MKLNYKYFLVYLLLIIYLILSKLILIPAASTDYVEFINPLFWTLCFGVCFFLRRKEEERIKSKTEKIQKLLIITILFYLIYFVSGFIVGYGYTIYDKSILGIVKNIISYVIPAIFQTYVICKLVFESYRKTTINILIFVIFALFKIDFDILFSLSGMELFKYIIGNLFVELLRLVTVMYLSYMASYQACLIYTIPYVVINIIVPFIPKYDWFWIMLTQFILSTIIYIVYRKIERNVESYDDTKIYKKGNQFFKRLFLIILFILIFFVAGVFTYKPIAIMSNSMVPTFQRGDMVVIEKIKNYGVKNLKVGDIVAFKSNGQIIIHRIIEKDERDKNNIKYTTKGDNNSANDPEILENQIIGVVKFKIVYVGYPSVLLNELLN